MNYIIANDRVGTRLDGGQLVTCPRASSESFPEHKARNLFKALPRVLKKFHFRLIPMSDPSPVGDLPPVQSPNTKTLIASEIALSDRIIRWQEKVHTLNGLGKEAEVRAEELQNELSNIDKVVSNITHSIEFSGKVNACEGYKLFRNLKGALIERREIKNEMIVVQAVLHSTVSDASRDQIDKVISNLQHRKFTYREVV